jgi:hypothetical protein
LPFATLIARELMGKIIDSLRLTAAALAVFAAATICASGAFSDSNELDCIEFVEAETQITWKVAVSARLHGLSRIWIFFLPLYLNS